MDANTMVRQKVYDAGHRLIHAWIAINVTLLITLGWIGMFSEPGMHKMPLNHAHLLLGRSLICALVARLTWGLIGPKHARLSALVHFGEWLKVLKSRKLTASEAFGHDPYASVAYLVFYAAMGVSCLSGLVLAAIKYEYGPFAATMFDVVTYHQLATGLHKAVLLIVTGFCLAHLGAMMHHENRRGHPVAQAMISGFQYRRQRRKDFKP